MTAQRRREPVREVPLSVTVLGGEALEQGGNKQLKDFVTLLPGVDYSQAGGGGGGSQITMRGVSTGAQVGPTVSVYVDDVPYGSSTAFAGGSTLSLDLGLFDIERIELLRGPQGTLYGAGAMGGLLKYVTLDPDTKSQAAKLSADVATTEKKAAPAPACRRWPICRSRKAWRPCGLAFTSATKRVISTTPTTTCAPSTTPPCKACVPPCW
ncbi:TonB-dependent receptor plug domain-containing protein [Undibacterium arcticum]